MFNPLSIFQRKEEFAEIKEKPPVKPEQETAWASDTDLLQLMGGFESYNPDLLVAKKGASIYRKMLRDPQVKAAYNLRVNIVISRGWRFEETGPNQSEMADFFSKMITDDFQGTWIQALRSIFLCKAHGYSVSEKIYDVSENNGKIRWITKAIKPKPFNSFSFINDEYGNLTKILQEQKETFKQLDPSKFVVMINHPELDPVWGESDLRACYRPYWEKDVTLKLRNIWLERHAGGFIVATPGEFAQAQDSGDRTKLEHALKNIQQLSAIIAPKGYEIGVTQANDTTAFESAVGFNNREISRALLIPNLIGFADEMKGGSRSLGDTQLDAFMMTVQEEGEYLSDTVGEQVFAELAWWNFGRTDYPRFILDSYTTTQKRDIAKVWIAAVKDGTVINTFNDEIRTRQLLMYPEREENAEPLIKPVEPTEPVEPIKEPKDEDKEEIKEKPQGGSIERPKVDNTKQQASDTPLVVQEAMVIKKGVDLDSVKDFDGIDSSLVEKVTEPNDVSFIDRVNFVDLEKVLDTNESIYADQMAVIVDLMFLDTETYIKKVFKDNDAQSRKKNINTITAKANDAITSDHKFQFKNVAQTNLSKNYDLGRSIAIKSMKKAVGNDEQIIKKLELKLAFGDKRCCSDSAWSVAHFVDGVTMQMAKDFFKSQAFKQTKDVTETMLAALEQALYNGIVNEYSINDIIREMQDSMPELIGARDKDGEISKKAGRARLSTISRTSISNIFNQASIAAYTDPNIGNFVQGMQYSAILDGRTSAICNSLDGKKFMIKDPIWSTITPPNHFNCRSMLVPITLTDKWTPDNKKGITPPAKSFGQSAYENVIEKEGKEPKGKPETLTKKQLK